MVGMAYISKGKKTNQNILKAVIKRQIYGANAIQDVCLIRTMIESERTFKKCLICLQDHP